VLALLILLGSEAMNEKRPFSRLESHEELRLVGMFRLFLAVALVTYFVTPVSVRQIDAADLRLAIWSCSAYLFAAALLYLLARFTRRAVRTQAFIGAMADMVVSALILHAMGGVASGVGMLTLISVALTALILPLKQAVAVALIALSVPFVQGYVSRLADPTQVSTSVADYLLFGLVFGLIVALVLWLGQRTRQSQELAERRRRDLSSLAEINEIIIQRLRTGVLVLSPEGQIARMNEAARHLMGMPPIGETNLQKIANPLFERFRYWFATGKHETQPLQLSRGVPSTVPRFMRMGVEMDANVLAFLEDDSRVARRAEELTLASLGRLSASIAHEVRNPLGAISHAAQLLKESDDLPEADKRLVDIITNHCSRVNGIVENVLQLSRRESSRPEDILLAPFLDDFLVGFKQAQPLGQDKLRVLCERQDLRAMIDPSQLNQALWNLVRNALRYGREPDRPADVLVRATTLKDQPGVVIDVIDRGPGIPPPLQAQLFEPFFSTRQDGTGLGLYITRQLLEANQASIVYLVVPGGGSCFRIHLATPLSTPLMR
jgi:two-component system sensor histidine kinase PilS (NtrC family)